VSRVIAEAECRPFKFITGDELPETGFHVRRPVYTSASYSVRVVSIDTGDIVLRSHGHLLCVEKCHQVT